MVKFAFADWKKDVLEAGTLRVDMARMEIHLIRWMFVFWLGQLGVTLTMVTLFLRAVESR